MKYYLDFKEMVNGKYIDLQGLELTGAEGDEFLRNLKNYVDYFKGVDKYKREFIEEVLLMMSEFACYQAAIKATVSAVTVTDPTDPDKKYIHARSVVSFEKSKRAWVNVYVQDAKQYFNPNYKSGIDPYVIKRYRSSVMLKLVEKLKSFCKGG
jgi:hypothetical protein